MRRLAAVLVLLAASTTLAVTSAYSVTVGPVLGYVADLGTPTVLLFLAFPLGALVPWARRRRG